MSDQEMTVVFSAANPQEAHLLRGLLADRDIDAFVLNESLQSAAGGVPVGQPTAPRVAVARPDEQKARQVVIAYQRQQEIGPPQVDDILPGGEEQSAEWPVCPDCGNRRQTLCKMCGVAGTDFPKAEYQVLPAESLPPAEANSSCACGPSGGCGQANGAAETDDQVGRPVPVLLRCETCDEAFLPQYYRLCPWCGHDFGEGIEISTIMTDPLNARTRLVLTIVGCAFFALLLYLVYMMTR